MYQLDKWDGFRQRVIIEECIKKLRFLGRISNSQKKKSERNELAEAMGEEISRVINEQRDLENEYSELITARSKLEGLQNKKKFKDCSQKIKQVAEALKESTKNLSKVLKDNPDIHGNILKIQRDRNDLSDKLRTLDIELNDISQFIGFGEMVQNELQKQDELKIKKQLEKQVSESAKNLKMTLKQETLEFQQETEEDLKKIQQLKERLRDIKQYDSIKLNYEKKDAQASEQVQERTYTDEQSKMKKKIDDLKRKIDTEEIVSKQTRIYLVAKEKKLQDSYEEWQQKYENEIERMKKLLIELDEKRKEVDEERQKLNEEVSKEEAESRKREEQERLKEDNAKVLRQEREAKTRAIEKIINEYLLYKQRVASAKAKRKGKKGGGKKGGGRKKR